MISSQADAEILCVQQLIKEPEKPEQHRKIRKQRVQNTGKKYALKSKNLRNVAEKEFIINEIVLATIPGFAPWPAIIIEIEDMTYIVCFFGTGQM